MENDVRLVSGVRGSLKFQLVEGGKVWELPLTGSLPVKTVVGLRGKTGDDALASAMGLFDELAPGLTDECTVSQLKDILALWNEASGVTVGESSGSAAS